jgi:hypothetical protein
MIGLLSTRSIMLIFNSYFLRYYKIIEKEGIMDLYTLLINRKEKVSVVGLGYVRLPIAVAFAKK